MYVYENLRNILFTYEAPAKILEDSIKKAYYFLSNMEIGDLGNAEENRKKDFSLKTKNCFRNANCFIEIVPRMSNNF